MLVIGCFGTIGLTVAGAIAGVMIGGTAAGRWGAAAGLLLGIAGTLLALWVSHKARSGLPE